MTTLTQLHMTKFHQHMRPRLFNPTYNSSHVGTSLGMFASVYYGNNNNHRRAVSNGKLIDQHYVVSPEQSNNNQYNTNQYINSQHPLEKPMQKPTSQKAYTHENTQPITSRGQQQGYSLPKANSHLSNYGTQSLLVPHLSERQVYEKQQKNYNIISIKPKEYNETIKKYPKYRLENQDVNFYKKIQLENQYRQSYHEQEKYKQYQMMKEYEENIKNQSREPKSNFKQPMAGIPTDFAYRQLHPSAPFNN